VVVDGAVFGNLWALAFGVGFGRAGHSCTMIRDRFLRCHFSGSCGHRCYYSLLLLMTKGIMMEYRRSRTTKAEALRSPAAIHAPAIPCTYRAHISND
jgi:hypothetical protein